MELEDGVIRAFPLLDTLSALALMMVLPNWMSLLVLMMFILLGNPKFLEIVLSFFFKHKLSALGESARPDRTIVSVMVWLTVTMVLVSIGLVVNPAWLDYPKLLAKALVAARLTSTKNRQTLDAVASSTILALAEKALEFAVQSEAATQTSAAHPFVLSFLFETPRDPLKLLMYHLSLSNTKFIFGFEYFVEFLYSVLALYTVMYRIQRTFFVHGSELDEITAPPIPRRSRKKTQPAALKPGETNPTATPRKKEVVSITIPEEVSNSILPSLLEREISNEDLHNMEKESEAEAAAADDARRHTSNEEGSDDDASSVHSAAPAAFPLDQQKVMMDDISSPNLVVAQNFENYLRVVLFPFLVSTPSKNPALERQIKSLGGKTGQQLLWMLVNAARTMLGQQDFYSGDYIQHNAVVATDPTVEYSRSPNSSSQCFVWYTGETVIAFELRNITLDQLLVRVNGIIWEHVSSASLYGRELVIVNGLSPLYQYDIDFIKILDNGELKHFASTTVSTIHQNRTLTESKPSTPLATLQESVVTTQNAIDREKAKLKKLKADWRKRSAALKSEIENLNNRSNVADESRNYKKLESLRQAVAKADLDASNVTKMFEELYAEQSEVEERYLDEKRTYESELLSYDAFKEENDKKARKQGVELRELETEQHQLEQKRERLTQKKTRLEQEVSQLDRETDVMRRTMMQTKQSQRKDRTERREHKQRLLDADIEKYEGQLTK